MKFKHIALSSVVVVACLTGCKDEPQVASNSAVTPPSADSASTQAPTPAPDAATPDSSAPDSSATATTTPSPTPTQPESNNATVPTAISPPPSAQVQTTPKASGKPGDAPFVKLTPDQKNKINKSLSGIGRANKEALKIPAPNTADWGPTTVTATTIADHVQRSIPMLRNTEGHIQAVIKTPEGGNGNANLVMKIRDTAQYDVPFVLVGEQPAQGKIISNGKFKMEQVQARWQKTVKSTDAITPFLATGFGAAFERDFSQEAFSPITKVGPSWPAIVSHWMDPSQGYNVTVEQRSEGITQNNKKYTITDYRIHAIRSPEAAKRLGASEISVVVDGLHSLPVTVQTSYTEPNTKRNWQITWGCSYFAGKKYTDKDFVAPYNKGGHNSLPTSS